MGAHDAAKQRLHVCFVRVIDAKRDGGAAGGLDHRRGFVDRLGPLVRRRLAFDASTGAVDRRAGFRERTCDATTGAARRSRHEGHTSGQRLAGSLLRHGMSGAFGWATLYSVAGERKDWTGLVSDPIFSIVQTLVSPAFR